MAAQLPHDPGAGQRQEDQKFEPQPGQFSTAKQTDKSLIFKEELQRRKAEGM